MLSGSIDISLRGVYHNNAKLGCGFEVHIVDTNSSPSNNSQLLARGEELLCNLGFRADDQGIIFAYD